MLYACAGMQAASNTVRVAVVDPCRLRVEWEPSALCEGPGGYDIEYPQPIELSARVLLAAIPAILALSRHGGAIALDASGLPAANVSAGDEAALLLVCERLARLVTDSIQTLYGERIDLQIELRGLAPASGVPTLPTSVRPALLFGGGAESLTLLARMLRDSRPALLRLEGPGWIGSDPELDLLKAAADREVADSLGLELRSIRTDAYQVMTRFQAAWAHGVRGPLFFANALGFSPTVVGVAAPFLGGTYGALHLGSEKEHAGFHTVYCLSPEFLAQLADAVAPIVGFKPGLLELGKAQIVRELWQSRPDLAARQYSCFSGGHERWCHQCEKCFRSYVLIVAADGDPRAAKLDGGRLLRNWPHYWRAVAKAAGTSTYHQRVYRGLFISGLRPSRARLAATVFPALVLGAAARQRAVLRDRSRTGR